MLDVRFGDRGPRVVLLQVLLNRRGGGLTVDGIFGPRTRGAVSDARRRMLGGAGGDIAGPDFWRALLDEQRLCGIDAFDMGEERFQTGVTIVREAGSQVVETGAMCNGVEVVVGSIQGRTRPPGSLGVLRTWGHGNRGHWLSFTVGEVVHTTLADPALGAQIAAERWSYVDPGNFDAMRPTLAPVGRCFASVGIYEHHGCSLGRIAETREMMRKLATLWGVPVTVAVGTQLIPFTEAAALRFQGQTFTAYPHGTERAWIAQVLAGERTSR
jgi:hypothetical protein